ncbi:hypothetical protein [Brevibacillus reuszeri]|nr:hypothetical protein [Brevibacillus reuszeri]
MSSYELISDLQLLLTAFEDPLFLLSTLMIAVAVCYGVKRLVLD